MSPALQQAVDRIDAAAGIVETEEKCAEGDARILLSTARSYLAAALLAIDDAEKPQRPVYVPREYTEEQLAWFAREAEERCPACGKKGALLRHWGMSGCDDTHTEAGWAKAKRLAAEAGEPLDDEVKF